MASAYPSSYDNFSNPSGSDNQNSVTVPHAQQHANVNDAVEAIEAELGLVPSAGSATVADRITAVEQSVTAIGATAFGALADGVITSAKLAPNVIVTSKIVNSAVTAEKLATDSVTSGKIANASVTAAKLANDSVTYAKVAASNKVRVSRLAVRNLAPVTSEYIPFDTENADSIGFFPGSGTTISVPSGGAGLYLITCHVSGFLASGTDYFRIDITQDTSATPTSQSYHQSVPNLASTATAMADLAEGGTVSVYVHNGHAGNSIDYTASLFMVKLFDS